MKADHKGYRKILAHIRAINPTRDTTAALLFCLGVQGFDVYDSRADLQIRLANLSLNPPEILMRRIEEYREKGSNIFDLKYGWGWLDTASQEMK